MKNAGLSKKFSLFTPLKSVSQQIHYKGILFVISIKYMPVNTDIWMNI